MPAAGHLPGETDRQIRPCRNCVVCDSYPNAPRQGPRSQAASFQDRYICFVILGSSAAIGSHIVTAALQAPVAANSTYSVVFQKSSISFNANRRAKAAELGACAF